MRVTNKMISISMLTSVERNRELSAQLQLDIATTKKVRRPSDDPTGVVQIERLKGLIGRNDQYKSNISQIQDFLLNSASALDNITGTLEEAKELAVQGGTDTIDANARASLAGQIDQLINVLVDSANSKYRNRYLYGGTLTSGASPYTRVGDTITYNGNNNKIKGKIGFETEVSYNITGDEIFNPTGGVDIFDTLVTLKQGLENNDTDAIQGTISDLNTALDQVISAHSELGILQDRLTNTESMIETENLNYADTISKVQDTDMVEALVNSQILQNAITSGLQTMANMIQTSLVDFVS